MAYEYLFSALLVLPDALGESPKAEPASLYSIISKESDSVLEIAAGLFIYFDLRAFERISIGAAPGEFALYTSDDFKERGSLPPWLKVALDEAEHDESGYAFGKVWSSYYRNLCEIAEKYSSSFLLGWLPWELGFRRALAEYRASSGADGISDQNIKVDACLTRSEFKSQIEAIVSHREKGYDAWRAIDIDVAKARIGKARDLAPPYSFNLDELISYMVQYMVYREFDYV